MDFLFYILGVGLIIVFFSNIKITADILCRILGGFAMLLIYNTPAPFLALPHVGVNFISSTLCAILGFPGLLLLLLSSIIF